MKRALIGIAILAALAAAVALVSSSQASSATAPAPTLAPSRATNSIIAEAKVVPVQSAALGFQAGGTVAEVPVILGEHVERGQVLLRLEARQPELQLAQADANLAAANARLNQLKAAPAAEDLAAARQNVTAAQASYDHLLHPDAGELTALKADVDKAWMLLRQAQAAYDRVGGDANPNAGMLPQRAQLQLAWLEHQKALSLYDARVNPSDAQVQQALAAVQNAKNQLAKLKPASDELAAAQASVTAAQASRDLAAEQLAHAKLVAPFAGTVISLDVRVGEYVAPGVTVVRVADTSAWQIETTDLTELSIVKVREGAPASVTFDAIPGLVLSGRVSRVRPYGENRQGDIVYTVLIAPDNQEMRLRWNMTAKVSLTPDE